MNYLEVLDRLGIDVDRIVGDWATCFCPFHDDRHPSLNVNLKTGQTICFVGCVSGSVVDIVKKALSLSSFYAMQWMSDGEKIEIPRSPTAKSEEEYYPVYQEQDVVKQGFRLDVKNKYLIGRGFTPHTIGFWKIYSSIAKICIPTFDRDGDIIGLIYRNLLIDRPKYLYSQNFPKRQMLFGANHFLKSKCLVLVEGPMDCIWLWQNGFPSVAVLGASLSNEQAKLLTEIAGCVFLCGDNDAAGQNFNKEAYGLLCDRRMNVRTVKFCGYKDVQEMTPPVLKKVMMEAFKNGSI